MRCFVCKGPFHPATGGVHGPNNTPFCGRCERSFFAWVREHTARSWGGKANRKMNLKFYAHARVPPPEVQP